MCGIAGKFSLDGERPISPQLIQGMIDVISHRGPDGEGKYVSGPVGLGHRRLSIIDLSTGAQPLSNEDRSVWITFNGEIYNYRELRTRLLAQGHVFRTQSDTETIVHLWEQHGVDCVQHLRGMFAFAIWDANRRALFIARDRVGIKPLYYCQTATALLFASEIKALLVDPEVSRDVSPEAIDRFLTYLYLPGPGTLFKNVNKLEPGHYLLATSDGVTQRQYWDLKFEPDPRWRSLDKASEALGALLGETVRDHMISDVPVGFLASGGVDSTALLSYAVEQTDKPIQTFTVGFSGSHVVDERPYARLASERFRTQHHEITISAEDFRAFLPQYVWHMEEPVCEPPAVALYYVSKLAREHVTVLLSGEGGDEAFGGYPEYRNYPAFERLKKYAGPFRGAVGSALAMAGRMGGNGRLAKYAAIAGRSLPDYYYSRVTTPHDYFNQHKRSLYSDVFAQTMSGSRATDATRTLFARADGTELLNQMLYVDTKTWLPDDLLVKADKITMANSLELRVPFLDHKVLELAATLPPAFKVYGRQTKRVLKRAFTGRVPDQILKRRKAGFPVPYEQWLMRDLRDFVQDTVLSSTALARGYFSKRQLERVLRSDWGNGASSRDVFALLVLELWHDQFARSLPTVPVASGAFSLDDSL
jgi:asparagine synthase (glutamine-hydrolysing)